MMDGLFSSLRLFLLASMLLFLVRPALGQVVDPSLIAPGSTATDAPVTSLPMPEPATVPRFWIRTDYLLWWNKKGPLSAPLATQGSINDPIPGALGQPNTQVLYGGNGIDFRALNGLRIESGFWFNQDRTFGIESGFFLVGGNSSRFSAFSDANGDQIIGAP